MRVSKTAAIAAFAIPCAIAQAATTPGVVTCAIEPERTVLAADTEESMVVKIALNGVTAASDRRAGINLAIVIDRSGSMSGAKLARAKEAAIAAVEHLDERDIVSVVTFDNNVSTIVPAQPAADKAGIARAIRAIQAGNTTAIFGGVSQAASELRRNLESGRVNRVLLLSDGQANVGPSTSAEFGRLGSALMKEGVSVSTVGLGLDYNEDLMTRLATQSDGNTYFVENSDDLPRVFSAELGGALSVVARDVKLRVTFKNGARPVELIGREGRIERDTVSLDFNQLYGNHQKYALVRVAFKPGEAGGTREFAEASVEYKAPGESAVARVVTRSSVSFSRDSKIVRESVSKEVLVETVRTINGDELEKAIQYNDAGDFANARVLNSANIARARDLAAEYDIPELEEEAAKQERVAPVLAAPMPSKSRKFIFTEINQNRNQQATR